MWAKLVAFLLPALTDAYAWVRSWFQARTDQANAVTQAERDHVDDGAQSVIDRASGEAQNAALDKIAADLDNSEKLPVKTLPKGKT